MTEGLKTALLYFAVMSLVLLSILIQGCDNPESNDYEPRGDGPTVHHHIIWRLKRIEEKLDRLVPPTAGSREGGHAH